MAALVVIPARYASTRFPAKMIASETGRPLVQHVVDRVRACKRVGEIVVAVDDQRIADALKPYQTNVMMTSREHPSGTDRLAEVARRHPSDVLINVQGDEPEIEPETVDRLIERLENHDDDMATAATSFPHGADPANPNLVKVVMSAEGRALYFSRSPIPFPRDGASAEYWLHLGIYAYRREFLLQFASWKPTPLEQMEKLEQLRALEHGRSIFVLKLSRAAHGIDTPEQYAEFVERYKSTRGEQR